jgi:hypothetical protein
MRTVDNIAIREAIRALVLVLLERKASLVFGGHPAITPLIRLLFHEAGKSPGDFVTLYQSRFFGGIFPEDNSSFERVVLTDAIESDREMSLLEMRRRMILDSDFSCAVFIGGMEGVISEFQMFGELRPGVPRYPVASTGAASREIYFGSELDLPELVSEFTYPTLFRKILFR